LGKVQQQGGRGSGDLKGATISVLAVQDPFFEPLQKAIPEFEERTGAKIKLEGVQYDALRNKFVLDATGGAGQYDVITIDNMWTGEFAEGNFVIPLDRYLENDGEEVNLQDFPDPVVQTYQWNNQTYGIPFSPYSKMFIYRRDLWEDPANQKRFDAEYGYELAPPKTWDQFRDMAEFFTQDSDGQPNYGVAFNGKRGASIVHHFFAYSNNYGGEFFQSYPEKPWNFTPVVNSQEQKQALDFYVGLRDAAPPEVTDFEWFDTGGAFWNSQVAMIYHWSVYAALASDPNQSKVVGKIGTAPGPVSTSSGLEYGGPGTSSLGGWSLGISSQSDQQDVVWEFVKWATSQDTMLKMTTENTFDAVPRRSVLTNPQYKERYSWADAYLETMEIADPEYRPRIPPYVQIEEVLGTKLNQALTGALSPSAALDQSNEEIVPIMRRSDFSQGL